MILLDEQKIEMAKFLACGIFPFLFPLPIIFIDNRKRPKIFNFSFISPAFAFAFPPYIKTNPESPFQQQQTLPIININISLAFAGVQKMAPELPENVLTGATAAASSERAYVTFLAGNGDYVKGVAGLAKGLRKVATAYPLVVAVLPDVPEEHRQILKAQGCIIREIEPIYPPENQIQFAMAYYVINYSKLRIWNVSAKIPNYLKLSENDSALIILGSKF